MSRDSIQNSKSKIQNSPAPPLNRFPRLLPDIGGIYCLVVFLALTVFAGGRALLDGDTLWHIKAGEVMLERGTVLTTDIFSNTVNGKPWLAHEWLSEVVMAALHNWGGVPAVVIFYFLLVSLSFWLLFRLADPYDDPWLAIFCVSLALVLTLTHLLARPHIFTWFFGTLTLYLLSRRDRWLFILPLLTALWANFHGGFVLGLALQGLFLAGQGLEWGRRFFLPHGVRSFFREQRTPLVVLLLSVLASGLTPFGYELLLFPFRVSAGIFSSSISEWGPPNLQHYWPFRLYIIFSVFLLFFRGPQVSWKNRLFFLFFLNAALVHARHISIAGLFLTPFLLEVLSPWFKKARTFVVKNSQDSDLSLSKTSGPVVTLLVAIFLLTLSGAGESFGARAVKSLFPLPEHFSYNVVRFLEEHPPPGNIFNQDELGDFFVYALGPKLKVFIDGRLDMYGEDILKDYLDIEGVTEKTDDLLKKYDVNWVIFPSSKPLVLYLKATGDWNQIFQEDQVTILARSVLRPQPTIDAPSALEHLNLTPRSPPLSKGGSPKTSP
jgi:hypothetical protein